MGYKNILCLTQPHFYKSFNESLSANSAEVELQLLSVNNHGYSSEPTQQVTSYNPGEFIL
jgi:hypothetical protein